MFITILDSVSQIHPVVQANYPFVAHEDAYLLLTRSRLEHSKWYTGCIKPFRRPTRR